MAKSRDPHNMPYNFNLHAPHSPTHTAQGCPSTTFPCIFLPVPLCSCYLLYCAHQYPSEDSDFAPSVSWTLPLEAKSSAPRPVPACYSVTSTVRALTLYPSFPAALRHLASQAPSLPFWHLEYCLAHADTREAQVDDWMRREIQTAAKWRADSGHQTRKPHPWLCQLFCSANCSGNQCYSVCVDSGRYHISFGQWWCCL